VSVAFEISTRQWVRKAACRNSPLFVAPVRESEPERRAREAEAKEVCTRCPVRSECLGYALRVEEPLGIWGGLDTLERRAITAD
jgi:WhiB family transcriptional regulator, redox-sensing transcriptional regulator